VYAKRHKKTPTFKMTAKKSAMTLQGKNWSEKMEDISKLLQR